MFKAFICLTLFIPSMLLAKSCEEKYIKLYKAIDSSKQDQMAARKDLTAKKNYSSLMKKYKVPDYYYIESNQEAYDKNESLKRQTKNSLGVIPLVYKTLQFGSNYIGRPCLAGSLLVGQKINKIRKQKINQKRDKRHQALTKNLDNAHIDHEVEDGRIIVEEDQRQELEKMIVLLNFAKKIPKNQSNQWWEETVFNGHFSKIQDDLNSNNLVKSNDIYEFLTTVKSLDKRGLLCQDGTLLTMQEIINKIKYSDENRVQETPIPTARPVIARIVQRLSSRSGLRKKATDL